MSDGVSDRVASAVTGAAGLALSVAYVLKARAIEDSLLADPVGASGVPVAVGSLMALASTALLVKAALTRAEAPAAREADAEPADAQPAAAHPHLLALGLLVLLSLYLLALPWLGYIVSMGLMAAAAAWLAGGRQAKVLLGFAVVTGPLLWLMFDVALRVRLPAGFWPAIFRA